MANTYKVSYLIAKRTGAESGEGFSRWITRIAIGSVAVGIAITLVAFAIFQGFRSEIQDKIFSLAAHIRISKFDLNNSYEERPIKLNSLIYQHADQVPAIAHIQPVANKAGLLKTDDEVLGVVLKGVSPSYDIERFNTHLKTGQFLDLTTEGYSTDIVISQKIARQLMLGVGDELRMYFVQDPPRVRKVRVAGIYETGIEDFDDLMVFGDLRLVQRLNNWEDDTVGSFEIYVNDFANLQQSFEEIFEAMDYNLNIEKVTDRYQHFFDWFLMLNRNVIIFLSIILFVAMFNMTSIMFIMIMERTAMIGTLKAIGATNWQVQQVFILKGFQLVVKGLAIGNMIGISFCLLQHYFPFIPLDYETYYMAFVPIDLGWKPVLWLNLLFASLAAVVLLLPASIVLRISPVKSIKFA